MVQMAGMAALVALVCSAAPTGQAGLSKQECVSLLNDGLRDYDRGTELVKTSPATAAETFREAADAFQRIADAGVVNGKLYYNLGNARLKCGQLGRAIANYRRAQRLMPADPRLKENLRYARSLCRYDIPERTERAVARTLFFWHYDTPLRLRFVVGLVAYAVFWAVLIGGTFVPRFRQGYLLGICLLIWIPLAASVGIDFETSLTSQEGVVTADEVVVRKGNGEGYAPQFEQPLADGVEFELLEKRGDWFHLRLADEQEGWVPASSAELI